MIERLMLFVYHKNKETNKQESRVLRRVKARHFWFDRVSPGSRQVAGKGRLICLILPSRNRILGQIRAAKPREI